MMIVNEQDEAVFDPEQHSKIVYVVVMEET